MKYNKEPLKLNSPVSFWMNFPNEERVFWVDRQSDRIVVGAKRLATVKDDDDRHNYAYVFYGDTFFDTVKDPKWSNMGHEMIAFTHYYLSLIHICWAFLLGGSMKVGIIMGSKSDLDTMKKASAVLDEFNIPYEMVIASAHRTPEAVKDFVTRLEDCLLYTS